MDQIELEIMRMHGVIQKTDKKGSFWIKFDLGYSKDEKIGTVDSTDLHDSFTL